ncbi:hypothetical protein PMI18_03933 [Pseudomonas sp. GM102]|jgi:putative transcriptional regulator|uniref:hypothetical protein n=1 Tax=Pseudomonas sp. GM102 TaxID=1144321 RepID=UPI00026FB4F5|nr:hypothetical protein [Pseudomonas sp. GM102]EJL98514.1 hypothetical protein PMI18_03933 [Pseudomonas sp. GM102]
MSKFFDELMESVQQMNEIIRGGREPSREFHVDALQVQEIHKATDLTQAKFAALIDDRLAAKSDLISLIDIHPTVDAP